MGCKGAVRSSIRRSLEGVMNVDSGALGKGEPVEPSGAAPPEPSAPPEAVSPPAPPVARPEPSDPLQRAIPIKRRPTEPEAIALLTLRIMRSARRQPSTPTLPPGAWLRKRGPLAPQRQIDAWGTPRRDGISAGHASFDGGSHGYSLSLAACDRHDNALCRWRHRSAARNERVLQRFEPIWRRGLGHGDGRHLIGRQLIGRYVVRWQVRRSILRRQLGRGRW